LERRINRRDGTVHYIVRALPYSNSRIASSALCVGSIFPRDRSRNLTRTGQLQHVMVGCRVQIPVGAFARFLERKVTWPEETKDRDFVGSRSAKNSMSPGQSAAAAARCRLARQTANKVKSSSRTLCAAETNDCREHRKTVAECPRNPGMSA